MDRLTSIYIHVGVESVCMCVGVSNIITMRVSGFSDFAALFNSLNDDDDVYNAATTKNHRHRGRKAKWRRPRRELLTLRWTTHGASRTEVCLHPFATLLALANLCMCSGDWIISRTHMQYLFVNGLYAIFV